MLKRQSQLFFGVTVVLDTACMAGAWILTYFCRFRWGPALLPDVLAFEQEGAAFHEFLLLLPVVLVCGLLALNSVGLYRAMRTRSLMREIMRASKAAFLAWVAMLAVFYFLRPARYSLKMVALFLLANAAALTTSRIVLAAVLKALRRRHVGLQRAAIIGVGELGRSTLQKLNDNPWVGIAVDCFLDLDTAVGSQEIGGVPVVRCRDRFVEYLQERSVDAVFVAVSAHQAELRDHILRELTRLPAAVAVMPDFTEALRISASVGEFEGMPVVQVCDTPVSGWPSVAKRMIDIAGALAGLALTCWIFPPLALLIKLTSRGPVFFRQERMGLGGRPFTMLKFRSMVDGAEQDDAPVRAAPNDARCTWLGRCMRRTSLDELPQLLNVLKGDMSLVGPRPERPLFVRQFTGELPFYMLRHSVKAGMTGWAQVNGLRGNTSIKKRLEYDLFYINNWSLRFDLFILLVTPFAGCINHNAY